jgi:integron integrase
MMTVFGPRSGILARVVAWATDITIDPHRIAHMTDPAPAPAAAPRTVLGVLREVARVRHYSVRTIEAYEGWVRRYLRALRRGGCAHPRHAGPAEARAFLTQLATESGVSAATQNQALAALRFFHAEVLGRPIGPVDGIVRAKASHHVPVVLGRADVARLLDVMDGVPRLIAQLLYGSGLRLLEACALRIQDLDLERGELVVRRGKGARDRVTMLPASLRPVLDAHLERVRALHRRDCARGGGWVALPDAFARKAALHGRRLGWQWVFPATRRYHDPVTGQWRRHHLHATVVQRAVTAAGARAGLDRRVTCHALRHSFATHLLEAGYDIRTIQQLLGHRDLSTTMRYTHVLNRGGLGVRSPADLLPLVRGGRGDHGDHGDHGDAWCGGDGAHRSSRDAPDHSSGMEVGDAGSGLADARPAPAFRLTGADSLTPVYPSPLRRAKLSADAGLHGGLARGRER